MDVGFSLKLNKYQCIFFPPVCFSSLLRGFEFKEMSKMEKLL